MFGENSPGLVKLFMRDRGSFLETFMCFILGKQQTLPATFFIIMKHKSLVIRENKPTPDKEK